MAIDDNASYELTGYQVKDLASKVRAKADSSSLASVATSGLYSDLVGAPTIPTVYNGTLTIQQNGTTLGTFSANQDTNETINITGGGGGGGMVVSLSLTSGSRFSSTEAFSDIISAYGSGEIVVFEVSGNTATIFSTDNYSKIYLDYGAIDKLELEFDGPSATVGSYSVVMLVDQTTLQTDLSYKQNNLTAGLFINIDNTDPANPVISSTDTTYSDFTGATSGTAGTSGLVLAPAAGDQDKYLKGDGTWGIPTDTTYTAGNGINIASNVISSDYYTTQEMQAIWEEV